MEWRRGPNKNPQRKHKQRKRNMSTGTENVDYAKIYSKYPTLTPIWGELTQLWMHKTRKTKFCVCVDDFAMKYYNQQDAKHFLETLATKFKYTVDWDGKDYCRLHLDWNYSKGYVDILWPNYVWDTLQRLGHKPGKIPQHSPIMGLSKYTKPGAIQYVQDPDGTARLDLKGATQI